MTEKLNVFKCESCGNIVEVLHAAGGNLVCCDKPMKLFVENTVEASKEKHVPVISRVPNGIKVTVGSILHPMEEKHYIEWIELLVGDKVLRQALKPGQEPVAVFEGVTATDVVAREFCNLHGLWKA
jgi:superoxide reductase